jgi:hypothetical protein
MTERPITLAELRLIDLFEDLDDEELAVWIPVTQLRDIAAGTIVAEQGEPVPGVELLLEGTIVTQLVIGDRTEPSGRQEAPTWMGAIAVLTEGDLGVRMVAQRACLIGLIPAAEFRPPPSSGASRSRSHRCTGA